MSTAVAAHLTSCFDRTAIPSAREYFERELGQLGRPNRKGWMMVRAGCCFHRSESKQSFFVHIDGGYCCFKCEAKGGSLIDFLMQRDRLDFRAAAKVLGAWRENLTSIEQQQIEERRKQRLQEQVAAEQRAAEERARRLALRDEIHVTSDIYRQVSSRLSELRGESAAEAYAGEQEDCWACLSLALDDLRLTESVYMQASGLDPNDTTEVFA